MQSSSLDEFRKAPEHKKIKQYICLFFFFSVLIVVNISNLLFGSTRIPEITRINRFTIFKCKFLPRWNRCFDDRVR